MYKLSSYKEITLEEIYNNISEEQLWRTYCHNFKKIDESFLSELYNDTNPSCRIYYNNKGTLLYKDFGTGESYGIINYIQAKYKCTFLEALNIIACDFNLRKSNVILNKPIKQIEETLVFKPKSKIQIEIKPWSIVDSNYWKQYYIPLELLDLYNVNACSRIYLHKSDKTVTFYYSDINPMYSYKFIDDGNIYYKIYWPLHKEKKYKWLFSGTKNCIEGYDQLNWLNDILILTKSLKDVMVYRLLGIDAISLQGEANRVDKDTIDMLLKRFKTIIVNYDNDKEGIKGTQRITSQFGFKSFYIDDYKDISDYIKANGLDKTKEMINNKLNNLNENSN